MGLSSQGATHPFKERNGIHFRKVPLLATGRFDVERLKSKVERGYVRACGLGELLEPELMHVLVIWRGSSWHEESLERRIRIRRKEDGGNPTV